MDICLWILSFALLISYVSCFIFRGKDHLYFQNVQRDKETLENVLPASSKSQNSQTVGNPLHMESYDGRISNDIISGQRQHHCITNMPKKTHPDITFKYFSHHSHSGAWKQA